MPQTPPLPRRSQLPPSKVRGDQGDLHHKHFLVMGFHGLQGSKKDWGGFRSSCNPKPAITIFFFIIKVLEKYLKSTVSSDILLILY